MSFVQANLADRQREIKNFISSKIGKNLNELIHHFQTHPEALEGSGYCSDDLFPILSHPSWDWEKIEQEDLPKYFKDLTEIEKREWAEKNSVEPDSHDEVFEHWSVDSWLAEELREKGEMVGEFFGFTVWGRAASGQSIILNSVIEGIFDEYHARLQRGVNAR